MCVRGQLVLLALTALGAASVARALEPQDVLFYAPFDGSVTPALQAGPGAPVAEVPPRFVPGKRGQALLVGGAETGLRYPGPGNWLAAQGTVAVWVCPQDWHSGDGKHHSFLTLEGQPTTLLYNYLGLPTYFLQLRPDHDNPRVGADVTWKEREWHHLVAAWQEGEFCLYVDGKSVALDSETMCLPERVGEFLDVGCHNFGTQDHTALDELLICRRALTPEEAKALYDFVATPPAGATGPVPTVTGVPPLRASLRHFPTAGRVEVLVRASGAGLPPGATLPVEASVLGDQDRVVARQSLTVTLGQPSLATFDVGKYRPGSYRVRLAGADATVPPLDLAFERRARPEWLGNRLGCEDEIPPPWPAVTQLLAGPKAAQVLLWGRSYWLDGLGFTQIETQGQNLLAAPLGLRLRSGGQERTTSSEGLKVVERTRQRMVFDSGGRLGELGVHARTTIEFDGFTWVEFELYPAKGGSDLEGLTWEMPYATDKATLFYSGVYYPALDNGTGAIRPEGFKGAWRNWFWVGNETGGLEWFAEDRRGWVLSKPQEALTIAPGPTGTLVRLRIVDQPTKLTKPLKFAFGFQATPVKPQRPDRRRWRAVPQQPESLAEKPYLLPADGRVKGVALWNTGWSETWMLPNARDWARDQIANSEQKGLRQCLYVAQNTLDPREPNFRYFWEDWRRTPGPPYNPAWLQDKEYCLEAPLCPASDYQDYFLWVLDKAIKQTDLRGIYFDNSVPGECTNLQHGCGVTGPDGTVTGTVPLRAAREWYKRAYVLLKRHDPQAIIAIHMSGYPLVPLQAFCDYMCDGENFTGYLQVEKAAHGWQDYTQALPLDVMRAQYRNHWGPETAFLPEFGRALGNEWYNGADPRVKAAVEHLLGLFFVHDSGLWPCWSTAEPYSRLFRAEDRFGWDEQVSFVPYWNLRGLAELETDQPAAPLPERQAVVLSLYQRPGQVMLVPCNNTDEDRTARLSWDAAALGLGNQPVTALEDYFRGERFAVTGHTATVPLPRRNFRMLVPVGGP